MEDLLTKSTDEIMKLSLEYSKLAAKEQLSEQEADRLGEILTDAVENEILSFWINEVDHSIGHHLGLLDILDRDSDDDQKALLREYLGNEIVPSPVPSDVANHRSILKPVPDCADDDALQNC